MTWMTPHSSKYMTLTISQIRMVILKVRSYTLVIRYCSVLTYIHGVLLVVSGGDISVYDEGSGYYHSAWELFMLVLRSLMLNICGGFFLTQDCGWRVMHEIHAQYF